MEKIKVQNLTKKFGTFTAIEDLSFGVQDKHITGFLGPNGAGKTTTLRLLVGLSKPTQGQVTIGDMKVKFGEIDTNRIIGYLPEQPNFYNWMSAEEYLNFVADIFKVEDKTKRIEKLLRLAGLTNARKKKISTYSLGMKQRLGIAQAMINDPEVIILDEPVSALDPIGRREVLVIINKLKEDKTILFSTHILSDVDRVCDDVVIINKGKLVTTSSLPELKEKYAKPLLELEFKQDPKRVIPLIKKEKWAGNIDQVGNRLNIWLSDPKAIDRNIPLKFFGEQNIPVHKYGLIVPSSEDLFVKLLKEQPDE